MTRCPWSAWMLVQHSWPDITHVHRRSWLAVPHALFKHVQAEHLCLTDLCLLNAGLSRAGQLTSNPGIDVSTGDQKAAEAQAESGRIVEPAIAWFWRALCHTESLESIAAGVARLSVNAYTYELVRFGS